MTPLLKPKNPILAREIDHRMRDNRTYFIPSVYTLVLGIVTLGAYLIASETGASAYSTVEGWAVGKAIFHVVAFTQMILVILLVPAVSAGSITGERDRGTLPLLLVTPMPRGWIATGKLLAPILYVLLLVCTSLPFAAISFSLGGTDLRLFAITYLCLLTATLSLAAMGLAVSSVMKRTVPAVFLAYGLVAVLVIGSGVGEIAFQVATQGSAKTLTSIYLNPFTPLFLTIDDQIARGGPGAHWWITPLLQAAIGAGFALFAWRRIRDMRE